jgi:hypothetical protein
MLWSHKLYLADYLQKLWTTVHVSIGPSHTACVLLYDAMVACNIKIYISGCIQWIEAYNVGYELRIKLCYYCITMFENIRF